MNNPNIAPQDETVFPPEPPQHKMTPPFDGMDDAKLLLHTSQGDAIADMHCWHRPKLGLFGIRAEVTHPMQPVVRIYGHAKPPSGWHQIGRIPVESFLLTEEQTKRIRKVDHPNYQFEVTL